MEKIDYESSLKHAYEVAKRYIDDYVRLCLQTKTKVQLNLSSIKRIVELHDELINAKKNREMPTIHIPKNTVYTKLRKLLPKEFEWIKTKKRLLKESEIQHHCVWTYGVKLTQINQQYIHLCMLRKINGIRLSLSMVMMKNIRYGKCRVVAIKDIQKKRMSMCKSF